MHGATIADMPILDGATIRTVPLAMFRHHEQIVRGRHGFRDLHDLAWSGGITVGEALAILRWVPPGHGVAAHSDRPLYAAVERWERAVALCKARGIAEDLAPLLVMGARMQERIL